MAVTPQESVRRHNLGAVLRYVHLRGATSRAELTSRLGLNRSTIGALAAELAAAGLIQEDTPRASGRAGRPSPVVRANPTGFHAYALSVEPDHLRAARVGLGGEILDSRTTDRPPGADLSATVAVLADLVQRLRAAAPAGVLVGCGVAIAGGAGILGAGLAEALGGDQPPLIGDPAALAALAEHVRGAASGLDDVLYLHGDDGITAGIITGGHVVTGHRGFSGQVGHMIVNPAGRPCRCGSRGCWAAEVRPDEPTADSVRWLGHGVANLVNILNPEAVVFGGTLRALFHAAGDDLRAHLRATALPTSRTEPLLSVAALGEEARLIGAAELAFERVLNDPLSSA
ncbi:ROK family protein [Actinoplanes aureus]|uniref:ROK family protein n=1 Tax=Actinoplanes aureus TaxID=2792083 RepID=A0A931FZ68_9ACTN|nr:ROK family protein [Actinoplanes aureus]MBG0564432.1 ROK family protein [Actinoplanes aureus]